MKLVMPTLEYKQSYLKAVKEGKSEKSPTTLREPKKNETFEDFIINILNEAKGLNLPEGRVPASEFWLIDEYEFIGRVSIRHTLNENLRKIGGHIGYYIRTSKRGKGYGKTILKLALKEAKKLGIKKALVTCDEGNIASQKIIEANKGVLENVIEIGENNSKKRRYWINLEGK